MINKINFILVLLTMFTLSLTAQQQAQYTQWMFNKQSLNSGYVVSEQYTSVSVLHRSQWVGLDGAPTSQSLNLKVPFKDKNIGIGLSINHDAIGPTNSWNISGIYAYNFDFGSQRNLGIGLRGTARGYRVKYSETVAITSNDGKIPTSDQAKTIPNFGVGLYYHTPKYFIGLSVPHILEGDLTFFDSGTNSVEFSREEIHSYIMAGAILNLNDALKLKPSLLFKHVKDSPFDLDLHTSLIFYDTFWAGLTYRFGGIGDSLGESLDIVLQLQLNNSIRFGFAYDFTLSKVKDFNDGTFELVLDYSLNPNQGKLTNPRFF